MTATAGRQPGAGGLSLAEPTALGHTRPAAVPADIRALVRSQAMTRPNGGRAVGRTVVLVAVWVGASALGLVCHTLAVWLPVWVLQAVLLHGAYSAMHDGAHGTLFASRRANRVANLACSAPLLLNAGLWRAWHLEHHRATVSGDDPEPRGELDSIPLYLGAFPVAGASMWGAFWWHSLRCLFGRPPGYARRRGVAPTARRDAIVLLALTAAAAAGLATRPFLTLALWLAPLAGYWLVVSLVFGLPEHYHAGSAGGQLDVTRSTRSCAAVRFVLWNSNYHAAHHLVPSVSYRHLPALDRALAGRAVHRSRSYAAFHLAQLAALLPGRPDRRAPGRPDRPADPPRPAAPRRAHGPGATRPHS